jgi:hypothetical protein
MKLAYQCNIFLELATGQKPVIVDSNGIKHYYLRGNETTTILPGTSTDHLKNKRAKSVPAQQKAMNRRGLPSRGQSQAPKSALKRSTTPAVRQESEESESDQTESDQDADGDADGEGDDNNNDNMDVDEVVVKVEEEELNGLDNTPPPVQSKSSKQNAKGITF